MGFRGSQWWVVLALSLACGDKISATESDKDTALAAEQSDADTDVDTDTDTDADTDADTDTDTDVDTDTDTGVEAPTWYNDFGGADAVDDLLTVFLARVLEDPEINWFFAHADMAVLQRQFRDYLCAEGGGECTYTGADMASAHGDMAITTAQFDAMMLDLSLAMSDLGVPSSYPEYPSVPVHSGDGVLLAFEATRAAIVTDPCGPLTPCVVVFNGLGGYGDLLNYVSILTGRLATDPLINARFSTTDMDALGTLIHAQLCALTGGYCRYLGLDMASAHAGMCITEDEWAATMDAFVSSLLEASIPYTSPNFDGGLAGDILLLTVMAMESDIVPEEPCD